MSVAAIRKAAREVMIASGSEDFFGGMTITEAKRKYRRYARLLHPDQYPPDTDEAIKTGGREAFARLEMFQQEKVRGKTGLKVAPAATKIATKRGVHMFLSDIATSGDMTNIYHATSLLGGMEVETIIKVAATAEDNDLLQKERSVLKKFRRPISGSEQYAAFVPVLDDAFSVQVGSDVCLANALRLLDGFIPLSDVRRALPKGVNPLDVAWMWRRLLVALGFAHDNGVIHGAVLPQNVMIHPELHGLVLIDWCYASVDDGTGQYEPIKAIVTDRRDWYPKEVLAKQTPLKATDIVMAARTMIDLLGGDAVTGNLSSAIVRPLRAFFKGCLSESPHARPQDAWVLLQEFDELLESIGSPYYPRRFRPFAMPPA